MDILKKSLEKAPIINKGKYQYIIHPLTDGIPEIKPNLLKEVTNKMFNIIKKYGDIDKIVTIEAVCVKYFSKVFFSLCGAINITTKKVYE